MHLEILARETSSILLEPERTVHWAYKELWAGVGRTFEAVPTQLVADPTKQNAMISVNVQKQTSVRWELLTSISTAASKG